MRPVALLLAMACVAPPRPVAPLVYVGDMRADLAHLTDSIGLVGERCPVKWLPYLNITCALVAGRRTP